MKIFLDENFPLQLFEELNEAGYECEHVISKSMRGTTDDRIARYLASDEYIFFTNDKDFLGLLDETQTVLFLSKLPQDRPIEERVEHWKQAVEEYHNSYAAGPIKSFEITSKGFLEPLEDD